MAKRKFNIKNSITFLLAIVVIGIGLFYYFSNTKKSTESSASQGGANSIIREVAKDITGELNIHFIDIGQGDCVFIEFPDGVNMLIDSGDKKTANAEKIINYIKGLGHSEIDLVLATHTDADHIGNMPAIFQAFQVNYCFRPFVYSTHNGEYAFSEEFNKQSLAEKNFKCNTQTYYNFLQSVVNEGCKWEFFNKDSDFESQFTLDEQSYSYTFDFLSPTENLPYIGYSNANDYSPICLLTYGNFEILLTGDASDAVEDEVLNYAEYQYKFSEIDVLKVGHHGSKSSTSNALLDVFNPSYAIILCGVDNQHKHPCQAVLDRLYNHGTMPYRSDLNGDIILTVGLDWQPNFQKEHEVAIDLLYIGQDN